MYPGLVPSPDYWGRWVAPTTQLCNLNIKPREEMNQKLICKQSKVVAKEEQIAHLYLYLQSTKSVQQKRTMKNKQSATYHSHKNPNKEQGDL